MKIYHIVKFTLRYITLMYFYMANFFCIVKLSPKSKQKINMNKKNNQITKDKPHD